MNKSPELWFRKARGFKLALELCLKAYWQTENRILMEPIKHLVFTSIELYLRSFLISQGHEWEGTKEIMRKGKHDLSLLLKECAKSDERFNGKEIGYIPLLAGSMKNYSGSRYPESGARLSDSYLVILEKLDEIISDYVQTVPK